MNVTRNSLKKSFFHGDFEGQLPSEIARKLILRESFLFFFCLCERAARQDYGISWAT